MMEEVVSTFHIHVRKCCASCAHKDLTRAVSVRYCSVHDKNVKPCDYCKEWRLSEQLKNAGNALGKVKRYDYLMYALDIRHNEAEKEELGVVYQPKTIDQIRQEFENKNGSVFGSL